MKEIPSKTFFMLDINMLEDIVKEKYNVDLIVLKGYPSSTIDSESIRFYDGETAPENLDELNVPLAKAFLHDDAKEVPDALSIIACLIEERELSHKATT